MSKKYIQVQPIKLAGSGITATATTIIVQSLKFPGTEDTVLTADIGDICYATLEPNSAREEVISFTTITQNADGTATLTGVTRNLDTASPYTQISSTGYAHAGGTLLVVSNNPQVYDDLASNANAETITGVWTFDADAYPKVDDSSKLATDPAEFVTKQLLDNTAIAGAPDASTAVKGVTKLTTAPSSATDPIAVGATDVATSGASKVIRSKSDSKLDDSLVALTTAGDLPYSDGTDLQRLAKGAEGTYLRAGASAPAWGGSNLDEANTFFGATDISGAEAESLTGGITTPLTTLHAHKQTTITATYAKASGDGALTYAHGLGAIPNWVKIEYGANVSQGGVGVYNRVANTHSGLYYPTALSGVGNGLVTDKEIWTNETGAPAKTVAGVVSVDATNVTITWTVANAPTLTHIYMVITCGV